MSHKPTAEQQDIYNIYRQGRNGVIEAFAGTGKTTTLYGISMRNKRDKILYLAYNRAIKDEAKAKFPRNAHCLTAAGLAFMPVTKTMEHKLRGPRMYANQAAYILRMADAVKISRVDGEDVSLRPSRLAQLALDTVMRFCYSDDIEISRHHVPKVNGADPEGMDELRDYILPYARRAWADLISPTGKLGWNKSHDYALKKYCLSNPDLSERYDAILFDEAQDANPAVSGLVQRQDCQQILVGDRNQAIYGWRGAQDAMQNFDADWRKVLTQSFRFGPAVASEANKWLTLLEAPARVQGFDQINSEVKELGPEEIDAILCRTNAQAIADAMLVREANKRYAIVGGTAEIENFAEAALMLQSGNRTDHPDLAAFQNWDQVGEFVNGDNGANDLKIFVNLIDSYGVPTVMQLAKEAVEERFADVTISTAHKAKGREWNRVRIGGDFREPEPHPETGEIVLNREEMMLAYVSVTRAKELLDAGSLNWVNHHLPKQQETTWVTVPSQGQKPLTKARRKARERMTTKET